MSYRVLPIPTRVAEHARRTGHAPGYGHPVHRSVAGPGGYGPCRHCLRRTREGEARLLFSYNPYFGMDEVPVVGPIFIHEEGCEAYASGGFPPELKGLPLVAQGHLEGGLVYRALSAAEPESGIASLLEDPRVAFITLRNGEAGCFVARVERV